MDQFSKVLQLSKMHTVPQRALDFGQGLGGLNQVYGPNHPTPICICGKYTNTNTNIFILHQFCFFKHITPADSY